jgi:tyrosyl-tRNA synthetase
MDLSGKKLVMQLEQRGLIAQYSGDENLAAHLDVSRTLYCGFDPTADSLHIGSLVPLLMLKRFQEAGHRPIILVGGSTGLIGDPSFKAEERKLNSPEIVAGWVEKIRHQTSQFVDFDENLPNGAIIVNNLDWTAGIDVLDFLRDVGKHFSINSMIQKESVKQRLQRDGGGISFTEFSYSLLQSLDFAELNRRYNCTLQIGGSDQWGNIVGGIDLTRRQNQSQCFGLTSPLITKADGSKFGKTESGTVWLNAGKTSPYSFYQFWLNVADEDVYKFLRYFTFLSLEEIEDIERSDRDSDKKPEAQRILAREATELVHGKLGVEAALRISDALFSGDPNKLSKKDFEQMCQDGISSSVDEEGLLQKPLTQILTDCGMVKAGREVKDALGRHSVFVNGIPQGNSDNMKAREIFSKEKALHGRFFLVRLGKKKYHLFERA